MRASVLLICQQKVSTTLSPQYKERPLFDSLPKELQSQQHLWKTVTESMANTFAPPLHEVTEPSSLYTLVGHLQEAGQATSAVSPAMLAPPSLYQMARLRAT